MKSIITTYSAFVCGILPEEVISEKRLSPYGNKMSASMIVKCFFAEISVAFSKYNSPILPSMYCIRPTPPLAKIPLPMTECDIGLHHTFVVLYGWQMVLCR